MKISSITLLAATAAAAPAILSAAPVENVEKRQLLGGKGKRGSGGEGGGSGTCFVFARGSTEPAPLGLLIGPQLQTALRAKLPGLKTYPVMYAASIATNVSIDRTDKASRNKGVAAFKQAEGCSIILAGGYSQGAAVMHNVIEKDLDESIKSKIAGVALFGSTRNKQDKGHIKNFPDEKSKTWCNPTDGVCGGGLVVNVGHLSYGAGTIREAATWLAGRAKA